MNRETLRQEALAILGRTGFYACEVPNARGLCFDVVARRDRTLILIKVLANVDALAGDVAEELKVLASKLDAIPFILGLRSGAGELETGVVYSRFGVPILALETLRDYLMEGVPPFIYSAPGGLYVRIDREVLQRVRSRGVSLGQLAEEAHVSRRTVQMYLEGMSATVEAALRLEKFLGEGIIQPLDPATFVDAPRDYHPGPGEKLEDFPRRILGLLEALGFDTTAVHRSPFDALVHGKEAILLTGLERRERDVASKAQAVASIARVAERIPVVIVGQRGSRDRRWGVAILATKDVQGFGDADEMVEAVEDRRD